MKALIKICVFSLFIACGSDEGISNDETISMNPELIKLNEAINSNTKDASLFLQRAKLNIKLGSNESAINDLNQSIDLDSTMTDAYFLRAKLQYDSKNYRDALIDLRFCFNENKEDPILNKMMAQICIYLGKNKEAVDFSNNIIKQDIHNAEAYFLKAYAFKSMNDTLKAISTFQTCLEQDPDMYKAHMQLGLLYSDQKNTLAVSYFDNAKRLKPDVLNPIYAKAIFYQNTDQHKQAKIIYQEMINSNSQFEKAYYNLGYIYLKEDSLEKARRMFSLAIGISPYYTDAFYNRGLCYEKENNFKEAIKDYKQSLNFDPDHELAQAAMERLKNKP